MILSLIQLFDFFRSATSVHKIVLFADGLAIGQNSFIDTMEQKYCIPYIKTSPSLFMFTTTFPLHIIDYSRIQKRLPFVTVHDVMDSDRYLLPND